MQSRLVNAVVDREHCQRGCRVQGGEAKQNVEPENSHRKTNISRLDGGVAPEESPKAVGQRGAPGESPKAVGQRGEEFRVLRRAPEIEAAENYHRKTNRLDLITVWRLENLRKPLGRGAGNFEF